MKKSGRKPNASRHEKPYRLRQAKNDLPLTELVVQSLPLDQGIGGTPENQINAQADRIGR